MAILIVDNDKNTGETLRAILGVETKYEVDVAYGGEEALKKMRQGGPYELVLLDIMMPKISGIDVCRAMIVDKKLKKIPVVLVSALPVASQTFQESLKNFKELGVIRGVVEKPFSFDDLLAKVRAAIRQ